MLTWDLAAGEELGALQRGPSSGIPVAHDAVAVKAVAVGTVAGRPVAVVGSADGTVRMWDLATGEQLGPDLVFPVAVTGLAVAADARLVVVFGSDVAVLSPR
ncbi:hypothetical protein ACWCXH_39335 [Kitasatospora sp. NPDC001660]